MHKVEMRHWRRLSEQIVSVCVSAMSPDAAQHSQWCRVKERGQTGRRKVDRQRDGGGDTSFHIPKNNRLKKKKCCCPVCCNQREKYSTGTCPNRETSKSVVPTTNVQLSNAGRWCILALGIRIQMISCRASWSCTSSLLRADRGWQLCTQHQQL